MKLWIISDLHRTDLTGIRPPPDFDALVVAGDVTDGDIDLSIKTVARLAAGQESVFVAGNHEYWGCAVSETIERGHIAGAKYGVHFLECSSVRINGLKFVGATLWNHTPAAGFRGDAADPVDIEGPGVLSRRAKPGDIRRLHVQAADFIAEAQADVIVSHYPPPSPLVRRTKTPVWICGHVHTAADFREFESRLVLNPVGYVGEITGHDPQCIVELPLAALEPAP